MHKATLFFLLLLLFQASFSQGPNTPIPISEKVKIGVLDNGLTYYLRENPKPENKVEIRLVVNVGSVLEDERQLGLAHFLEHMAFNGTKSFKKNDIVSFLQSIGVEFGADLNAYTSFDETVYILPIPLEKPENLDNGFKIIKEMGFDMLLEESWELAKKYNLISFDLGSKISGSGFPVYIGKGAKLQRALINYFIDFNTKEGYEEIQVPLLVNSKSATSTGQLPDKDDQMYHVGKDNLYLIPTSEVPVTNIYRNTLLNLKQLPIKMTSYTPCFRREAGSYGSDVRGLNRLHQFDKVEIVRIENPECSYDALNKMLNHVKKLLHSLELPYRILNLCGGDLGFTSAITYDFEIFSSAQNKWLEVSSVSNFETFQSIRLKLKYKDINGKNQFAHTLNGSSLALPRVMAGILENNQTNDSIKIPKVLIPYTDFKLIN